MKTQGVYGQVPSIRDLQQFSVNRTGQAEAIRQTLYDFQEYPAGGSTELQFFQIPKGQGGKTIADTNMTSAGQLANPISFLVESIEILFFPGVDLSTIGAPGANDYVNDVQVIRESGSLDLYIGSKSYLQEAPLGRFPPKTRLDVAAALSDTTTAAAAQNVQVAYADLCGRPYFLQPPLLLVPNQNFNVSLRWPAAAGVSAAGRIGIVMDGILYRESQ